MNGQLNEQPLAELVREVFWQRLNGALRLKHEGVKTVIYFEAGEIIYAASNLRELRLIEYLQKQGLVSAEQLKPLGNSRSDLSLAAALIERGVIGQQAVKELIAQQVTDVLGVALLFTQGTWKFEEHTRLSDPIRIKLDVPGLLLLAARRMGLPFVATQLSNPVEIISPVAGLPDFTGLSPAEGFVLSRVDAPLGLHQLVLLSGLRELEALRTIYGLALGGFIEREHWRSTLKRQGAGVTPTDADKVTEKISSPEVSVHTLAAELDELLARLDSASSHYEVLNVEASAGAEDIKLSYYALARRYHPDRFHMQAGTPLHASIESAFARIAQAYVALTDQPQRSAYDAKLAARERARRAAPEAPQLSKEERSRDEARKRESAEGVADSEWTRAESSFQEGFVALQQGQTQAAIVNLAAAARLAPSEARFRAYYGRALAAQEDTRRLAEAEMQAAVKLAPENSSYRLMLAELYCDLGFFRRAEGELKRVMSAELNNPAGRKLLRRLEAARATT